MRDDATYLRVKRHNSNYRTVQERISDYREVLLSRDEQISQEQASRCMDCGTPFCHWGCPSGNYVPEWNDYLAQGEWEKAYHSLQATNNLPEITGRLCPGLCESACVLVRCKEEPVTIPANELAIIEHAFEAGFVKPTPPAKRSGKSVAIVGSGPAGLACADQLNKAGHRVVVFERDAKPGGMLRYGIPDFKLEKWVIDRRLRIWEAEGMTFKTGVHVGVDLPVKKLRDEFDAVCLAGGSRLPRDLPIEGRNLRGIHFAMDYLTQSNRSLDNETIPSDQRIDAKGKRVVVIGGGDTGSDCVGTAKRQGATHIIQIELMAQPPEQQEQGEYWPDYPMILRTSSSHEEGCERRWAIMTKYFSGMNGSVKKLSCVKVEHERSKTGQLSFREIPGTEFEIEADLVLLAMGFVSPEQTGLLQELEVARDPRGNVATDSVYSTSIPGIFAAGDMHRGQSLVIWAIAEGRKAARSIDLFLTGNSKLPLEAGRNYPHDSQASRTRCASSSS